MIYKSETNVSLVIFKLTESPNINKSLRLTSRCKDVLTFVKTKDQIPNTLLMKEAVGIPGHDAGVSITSAECLLIGIQIQSL